MSWWWVGGSPSTRFVRMDSDPSITLYVQRRSLILASKKWCRTTVQAAGMALARAVGISQLPLTPSSSRSCMYV
jgi:hypothetical protein